MLRRVRRCRSVSCPTMNYPDILAVAVTLFFVMDPLGNIPTFNAVPARFEARRARNVGCDDRSDARDGGHHRPRP